MSDQTYRHTAWAVIATLLITNLTTFILSFPVEFLMPYTTYFLSYGLFGLARPEIVYLFLQRLIWGCLGAVCALALVSIVFRRANYRKVMWWCFGFVAAMGVLAIGTKLFGLSIGIERFRDEIWPVLGISLGLAAGYLMGGYTLSTMPR
jgi:hypothetical protein